MNPNSRANSTIAARCPESKRAKSNGVVMPTVCVDMLHFIGAFDDDLREDAITQMDIDQCDGGDRGNGRHDARLVWDVFSCWLRPFEPPRDPDGDRAVLLDGLGLLGQHAQSVGVKIFLEPLNQYTRTMRTGWPYGISLIKELADSVQLAADTYHQNIEKS